MDDNTFEKRIAYLEYQIMQLSGELTLLEDAINSFYEENGSLNNRVGQLEDKLQQIKSILN